MRRRIVVASMPRTGSTWTLNIIRDLFRASGMQVLPEVVTPDIEDAFPRLLAAAARDSRADTAWVLKTHRHLRDLPPGFALVTAVRDPRDALVSYVRFTRLGWPRALAAMRTSVVLIHCYRQLGRRFPLLELSYAEIRDRPEVAIGRLAAFLQTGVGEPEIRELARRFDRTAVHRRIDRVSRRLVEAAEAGREIPADRIIPNADGSLRLFDPETGFQSGHVSDYRDGDWERHVPPDVLAALHRSIGPWLIENGFASDEEVARWAAGEAAVAVR